MNLENPAPLKNIFEKKNNVSATRCVTSIGAQGAYAPDEGKGQGRLK